MGENEENEPEEERFIENKTQSADVPEHEVKREALRTPEPDVDQN